MLGILADRSGFFRDFNMAIVIYISFFRLLDQLKEYIKKFKWQKTLNLHMQKSNPQLKMLKICQKICIFTHLLIFWLEILYCMIMNLRFVLCIFSEILFFDLDANNLYKICRKLVKERYCFNYFFEIIVFEYFAK